jgi:hypothetical protein
LRRATGLRQSEHEVPRGSGKAEGFADGEWADHRRSFDKLKRGAATR